MSKQLTDWFPADVKPVHIGCYQVDDKDCFPGSWYAYWDGFKFCYRGQTPQDAFQEKDCVTGLEPLVLWRGLAEKP